MRIAIYVDSVSGKAVLSPWCQQVELRGELRAFFNFLPEAFEVALMAAFVVAEIARSNRVCTSRLSAVITDRN